MSLAPPAAHPPHADQQRAEPQRLIPAPLEDKLVRMMGRGGGVTLIIASLAVSLSIVTWSAGDPSLTFSTGGRVHNLLGSFGAIVSDLLLQILGFATVPAMIAPLLWGIDLVTDERVAGYRTKAALYPISLLAMAGALSGLPAPPSWPLHHGLGGILGDVLFNAVTGLVAFVNPARADLVTLIVLAGSGLSALAASVGIEPRHLEAALWPAKPRERPSGSPATWLKNRWQQHRARREPDLGGIPGSPATTAAVAANHAPHPASTAPGDFGAYDAPGASCYGAPHESVTHMPHYAGQPVPWGPVAVVVPAGAEHDFDAADLDPLPSFITGRAREPARPTLSVSPQAVSLHAAPPMREPVSQRAAPHIMAHEPLLAPAHPPHSHAAPHAQRGPFAHEPVAPVADVVPAPKVAIPPASMPAHADEVAAPAAPPAPAPAMGLLRGLVARRSQPVGYRPPSLNLLKRASASRPQPGLAQTVLRGNARLLEDVLKDFGVKGEIRDIRPGPVVTLYELEPARGTKSSRVIGLADDIARSMSAVSVRVAVVPGRNAIGIELPNTRREGVLLREILEADTFKSSAATLPIALGKSIGGEPVVADLARMPHLLVAGTTGSGKSVGINAFVLSLLYRHAPEDVRLIMIDPKMLELSVYDGIPHLLTPVVTDPQQAVAALEWAVREMEERYKRMARLSVRNIDVYNNRVRNAKKRGEMLSRTVQTGFDRRTGQAIFEKEEMALEPMPYIVIVVDEFADLMIVAGKEIEAAVQRLAQMARAAGIHLVMATQRPSVDIITGTIKANFPCRLSFKVASKIDSRTILNDQGAEQLLGQGDMLYSNGSGQPARVHGAFVSDEEVETIARALREQGEPRYVAGITDPPASQAAGDTGSDPDRSESDLYDRAVAVVMRDRKASTSYLQRRLGIGYNRAADLIERMEREGLVTPANAVGKRDILNSVVPAAE